MKKVLIFLERNKIEPKGGPYGYNYNLLNGLKNINSEFQIDTLDQLPDNMYFKKGWMKAVENKLRFFEPYPQTFMNQFESYDVIHFHTSVHMYRARNFLKNYKGKVVFTSHSPMLLSREMFDDASKKSKLLFKPFFDKLSIIDQYAFNRADSIIFPCEEAEEPYWNEEIYKDAKGSKPFLYMTTGVEDCMPKVKYSRCDYRRKYNIPKDAFVISYVGRHNEVKGYARLKASAEKVLLDNPQVYFLIGGTEKPLIGLKDSRWIEVGYTKDPYSLINASDVFVLPNLQTYFDLVLLEVISLGKKVILSETGGNNYFRKYNSKSMIYFNTDKELVNQLNDTIKNADSETDTRAIYLSDYTCVKFAERYVKLLKRIVCEEKNENK